MKKLLSLITLFAVSSILFAQKAGDKIEFSSQDLNSKAVTSEIFSKNKLTMVNIWGTFCGPCIREMPDLASLNEANAKNGVQIVGIPIDIVDRKGKLILRAKNDADGIIKQTGASYVHIVPSKEMLSGLLKNVQAVPTTIFVDSNGTQIGDVYLGAKSQGEWQKIIDEILLKIN